MSQLANSPSLATPAAAAPGDDAMDAARWRAGKRIGFPQFCGHDDSQLSQMREEIQMNQRARRKSSRLSPLERAAMRWWNANPYSGITDLTEALKRACARRAAALKKGKP